MAEHLGGALGDEPGDDLEGPIDPFGEGTDPMLRDDDLLNEVELTANLIVAASETDDHLTQGEIDEILGIAR
jgi:hypothetical protein